jgi:hypothetical protein
MLVGEFRGVAEDFQKLTQQITAIVNKAPQYIQTASNILEDPALPATLERFRRMREIEEADRLANREETPKQPTAIGVGLSKILLPLDAFIYTRRNPWVPYAVVGLAVALPLAVGFGIGRITRRR